MARVLRIINRFNLGGITYNVSYLSRYLPNEFETMLIGGPEEKGEESSLYIPRSLGLQPLIIAKLRRSVNPLNDVLAFRAICKIIREFKPDIVHTHASKAGAIGRLAAIRCKVPVIVHTFHGHVFHGYFGKIVTSVFKTVERFLANKSNMIVVISPTQQEEICNVHKICKKEKTRIIPLGFDLAKFTEYQSEKRKAFREKYFFSDHTIVVVIIGRLAPIKNHRLFISGFAAVLKNTNKKIKALIVGDGEIKDELMDFSRKRGLKTSLLPDRHADIIFTGWVKEVDVVLAGSDIVCLSSDNEGTPVSLIEAQAASRFVVSTKVGGIADVLHPECGRLSEPRDENAFTKNLLDAVDHFEKYKIQAGLASDSVRTTFSYQRLCDDMTALYRELLSPKS
jgi:glycosyltransferase involved in cell wall biosynthesis